MNDMITDNKKYILLKIYFLTTYIIHDNLHIIFIKKFLGVKLRNNQQYFVSERDTYLALIYFWK